MSSKEERESAWEKVSVREWSASWLVCSCVCREEWEMASWWCSFSSCRSSTSFACIFWLQSSLSESSWFLFSLSSPTSRSFSFTFPSSTAFSSSICRTWSYRSLTCLLRASSSLSLAATSLSTCLRLASRMDSCCWRLPTRICCSLSWYSAVCLTSCSLPSYSLRMRSISMSLPATSNSSSLALSRSSARSASSSPIFRAWSAACLPWSRQVAASELYLSSSSLMLPYCASMARVFSLLPRATISLAVSTSLCSCAFLVLASSTSFCRWYCSSMSLLFLSCSSAFSPSTIRSLTFDSSLSAFSFPASSQMYFLSPCREDSSCSFSTLLSPLEEGSRGGSEGSLGEDQFEFSISFRLCRLLSCSSYPRLCSRCLTTLTSMGVVRRRLGSSCCELLSMLSYSGEGGFAAGGGGGGCLSAGWGGGDLKVIACGLKGVVWEAGGWGGVRWAVVGGGAAERVGESWDFLSFFSSFLRLNLARLAVMQSFFSLERLLICLPYGLRSLLSSRPLSCDSCDLLFSFLLLADSQLPLWLPFS